jgi:acylphosphatase
MPAKQVTVIIEGDVQFVGLRSYVEELASRYDLAGFVYNDIAEGNVKFVCEGEVREIDEVVKGISKFVGVEKVSIQEKVILPRPVGRVVIGVERDIFERLNLGVRHLASIDGRLASIEERIVSMDTRLGENTSILKENTSILKENRSILKDIKNILEKIAEK